MKRTSNWIKAPVVIFVRAPLMILFGALVAIGHAARPIWEWLGDNLPGFD